MVQHFPQVPRKLVSTAKGIIFQETSITEGTAAEAQSEEAKRTEEPTEQFSVKRSPLQKNINR